MQVELTAFDQGAERLVHEVGVAPGPCVQVLSEVRGDAPFHAEDDLDQRLDLLGVEGSEDQGLQEALGVERTLQFQQGGNPGAVLRRAARQDPQDTGAEVPDDEVEQGEGRGIGPVQVLEDDQGRLPLRNPLQKGAESPVEAGAELPRIQTHHVGGGSSAEGGKEA